MRGARDRATAKAALVVLHVEPALAKARLSRGARACRGGARTFAKAVYLAAGGWLDKVWRPTRNGSPVEGYPGRWERRTDSPHPVVRIRRCLRRTHCPELHPA